MADTDRAGTMAVPKWSTQPLRASRCARRTRPWYGAPGHGASLSPEGGLSRRHAMVWYGAARCSRRTMPWYGAPGLREETSMLRDPPARHVTGPPRHAHTHAYAEADAHARGHITCSFSSSSMVYVCTRDS